MTIADIWRNSIKKFISELALCAAGVTKQPLSQSQI